MKKIKRILTVVLVATTLFFSNTIYGAINCPAGENTCYFKVIYRRPLNTAGLTQAQKSKLEKKLFYHADYSVTKVTNGNIEEETTTGFFAKNGWVAIFNLLFPFWNEVSGIVRDTSLSNPSYARGVRIVRKETVTLNKYKILKTYNKGMINHEEYAIYALGGKFGDNCIDYADNMYDNEKHGLE